MKFGISKNRESFRALLLCWVLFDIVFHLICLSLCVCVLWLYFPNPKPEFIQPEDFVLPKAHIIIQIVTISACDSATSSNYTIEFIISLVWIISWDVNYNLLEKISMIRMCGSVDGSDPVHSFQPQNAKHVCVHQSKPVIGYNLNILQMIHMLDCSFVCAMVICLKFHFSEFRTCQPYDSHILTKWKWN